MGTGILLPEAAACLPAIGTIECVTWGRLQNHRSEPGHPLLQQTCDPSRDPRALHMRDNMKLRNPQSCLCIPIEQPLSDSVSAQVITYNSAHQELARGRPESPGSEGWPIPACPSRFSDTDRRGSDPAHQGSNPFTINISKSGHHC